MSTKEKAKGNPGPVQFRRRSLLGVSVGLFLLFGILLNICLPCWYRFRSTSTGMPGLAGDQQPGGCHIDRPVPCGCREARAAFRRVLRELYGHHVCLHDVPRDRLCHHRLVRAAPRSMVGILDARDKQLGSAALLRLDRSDVCELRSLAQRSLRVLQPCRVARRRRDGTRLVGVTAAHSHVPAPARVANVR